MTLGRRLAAGLLAAAAISHAEAAVGPHRAAAIREPHPHDTITSRSLALAYAAGTGRLATITASTETGQLGALSFGWDDATAFKVSREAAGGGGGLLGRMGWTWQPDGSLRVASAASGERAWGLGYGNADELLELAASDGEAPSLTSGLFGRLEDVGGEDLAYDAEGRRVADGRFSYTYDWRGRLVAVEVLAGQPEGSGAAPYEGHRIELAYDAVGRLLTRRTALVPGPTKSQS